MDTWYNLEKKAGISCDNEGKIIFCSLVFVSPLMNTCTRKSDKRV